MTPRKVSPASRRGFLRGLVALLPAIFLFRTIRPTASDDIVEVDGWILKRSDLS